MKFQSCTRSRRASLQSAADVGSKSTCERVVIKAGGAPHTPCEPLQGTVISAPEETRTPTMEWRSRDESAMDQTCSITEPYRC